MDNLYLKRYAYPPVLKETTPSPDLRIIVTIPSYKEPELVGALQSLAQCTPPKHAVHTMVSINQPEDSPEEVRTANEKSCREAQAWILENQRPQFGFSLIKTDLPPKQAGVGLARKIAMDEAVRLFEKLKPSRPQVHDEGVIVCYDADCLCDRNYLVEIENHYLTNRNCPAAVVYYEHPLEGSPASEIYEGAAKYELFLRYHVNALRYAGFPYAHQTVGSCITVRSSVYQKQGGMNRRQAGEDFYFLQKLFPLEGFSEINTTRVIPSPRLSDRVPFGTGKAIGEYLRGQGELLAYHPLCYEDLRCFLASWSSIYQTGSASGAPKSMGEFLLKTGFENALGEILGSSPKIETFYRKFFHWFNGFRALKFIHFARDRYYPSIPVEEAAAWLMSQHFHTGMNARSAKDFLVEIRRRDRQAI